MSRAKPSSHPRRAKWRLVMRDDSGIVFVGEYEASRRAVKAQARELIARINPGSVSGRVRFTTENMGARS